MGIHLDSTQNSLTTSSAEVIRRSRFENSEDEYNTLCPNFEINNSKLALWILLPVRKKFLRKQPYEICIWWTASVIFGAFERQESTIEKHELKRIRRITYYLWTVERYGEWYTTTFPPVCLCLSDCVLCYKRQYTRWKRWWSKFPC